jgi:hypothetical protein
MQTIKELSTDSFDAIHGIIVQHLIENYGECDHDKHGELMTEVVEVLYEYTHQNT